MSADEIVARDAFLAALHNQPIANLNKIRGISAKTSPHNHVTLARAALVHAGEISAEDFNPLVAETSTEVGSPLYDFSWSLCTYATIPTQPAIDAYTAMLAVTALCLCPAERIALRDLSGDHRRGRNYGMANYRGPISALPGNRRIWDRGEAALYAERSIAAPLAAWALGQSWSWNGWNHHVLGWAMEAAVPRSPDGHRHGHRVHLPGDPESLVSLVARLRMRSNQRLEILRFADGGLFCLLNVTSHHTRGPALITEYVPEQKLLREISPAQGTGGGQWTDCQARLEADGSWSTWQTSNPDKRISGRIRSGPMQRIVWDSEGCRIEGFQSGIPTGDPNGDGNAPADPGADGSKIPDPIQDLSLALGYFDLALKDLGKQGHSDSLDRELRGRTLAEIMKLVVSQSRREAFQGVQHLLTDMQANGWDR